MSLLVRRPIKAKTLNKRVFPSNCLPCRFYSSDDFKTSFAQMYEALRPIEERIIALNLERINDTAQIDALLQKGLITSITADFYRTKINEQATAFSWKI